VSPAPNGTESRILEAALRTLARQGADNFSMAGIGREAGISRRTLYRYFHNRDEVLQAVAVHVGESYARVVDDVIAADPDLDRRVEVVLHATVHYADYNPAAIAVLRIEPAFTYQFLESTIDRYIEVVRNAIAPVADRIPAVRAGKVTELELAEVVVRLGISGFSLRSEGSEALGRSLARLIRP